jgi:hypothetical protein
MPTQSPFQIVQQQLDAYNRRDIGAFIELFAEDACGYDLGSATPTMAGKAQIRARYEQLFANSPALHSSIVTRLTFGHVVIDLERIAGRNGATSVVELLIIYEVTEGLIRRFHVVREAHQ